MQGERDERDRSDANLNWMAHRARVAVFVESLGGISELRVVGKGSFGEWARVGVVWDAQMKFSFNFRRS
jgi:hypothetical protein